VIELATVKAVGSHPTATSTLTVRFATGSASLPAGTYNVGLCATNPSIGPVQKNGNTVGVVTVTQ